MAEAGGEVDDGRNTLCNLCEEGGLKVKADQFCVSCEQYLCDGCKLFHSRVKATKFHEVLGINEIPSLTSPTLGSEAMDTPTCKDHQRPIMHFCISHMTELCPTCRMMEHKKCNNITEFRKAIRSVFTEEHTTRIHGSLENLICHFNKCKDNAERCKDNLFKDQQSAIDNVKQARLSVDKHLDRIECDAYAEIDKVFKAEMKQLDDLLHVCDVTINKLQKRLSKLERATALGDIESKFVIINNITKEIKQHCEFLKDTIEDTNGIDVVYENNDSIDKIAKILPNLGTLAVIKSQDSQSYIRSVAIYTSELTTRTASDTERPGITSYELLPDGRQLLIDYYNKKLKLYDSKNHFMSELALPDKPLSSVLIKINEAVVSMPNISSLQYINIGTDIALSDTKKLKYQPWAIVKYGDNILATVYDRFWKVVVIDNRGTVNRTIYQGNGSIIYIGLSFDQKTVYVLDEDKGCIGLTMGGNVVFQYQDQKVNVYGGLAVGMDYLFIGVKQGNDDKVRRLSLSGEYLESMNLGYSAPLKLAENTLIVTNFDGKGQWFIRFFFLL